MVKGKLLVRGTTAMMDGFLDPMDVALNDTADSSSGSLIYGSYVIRSLEALGYAIDVDSCGAELGAFGEEEAARANVAYDAYVIPLGDVLRPTFADRLKKLARFVRRLEIPCVVVGIGAGGPVGSDEPADAVLGDAVKSFMESVLSRSSCVGVRGSHTVDYLAGLGFSPSEDLMIIGHPALVLGGSNVGTRPLAVTGASRIALQAAYGTCKDLAHAIWGIGAEYQDSFGVVEATDELRRLYLGQALEHGDEAAEALYRADRMVYCTSASSWIETMGSCDLVVSNSLEGVVAAHLAGTPAIFIASDEGGLETALYHGLPYVPYDDATASLSLDDLAGHVSACSPQKSAEQQFATYALFLQKNGLGTLEAGGVAGALPMTPAQTPALRPLVQLSKDEAVARVLSYGSLNRERLETQVAALEELLREHQRVVADTMGAVEAARFMRDGVRASIESLSLALQQRK